MAYTVIPNGNTNQAALGSLTYGAVTGACNDIAAQIQSIQSLSSTDSGTLIVSNMQLNVIETGTLANDYYCTCLVEWTTE